MQTGHWLLTAASWGSILAGSLVTLIGFGFIGILLFGRGVPVGGAGVFLILTLGAGPLLVSIGPAVIFAATKLGQGHAWARSILEFFFWICAAAPVVHIAYQASRIKDSFDDADFVRAAVYFALASGPPIGMVFLLRTEAIMRAMVR